MAQHTQYLDEESPDQPATTVAVSALEPAAEPPVETTEAEDLNTEKSR